LLFSQPFTDICKHTEEELKNTGNHFGIGETGASHVYRCVSQKILKEKNTKNRKETKVV
jgi:hypothetical protein